MKKIDTVLFDLDGTLTDPGEGITKSAAHALKYFGIEISDLSVLYPFIGPPLKDSFTEYYGFTPEEAASAVKYYREYYENRGIFENVAYDGIIPLLKKLKKDGKTVVMATSKPEKFAKMIAERFGFAEYFDLIAGAAMNETRTAKDEVIAYALEKLGKKDTEKNAVMVGDRSYDVLGAAKFNIPTVGVLYGYGSEDELLSAGAAAVAKTPEEVYEKISEIEKQG